MLLRSSIASTRKFFQKTLHNFKSLFSPGYQRLPKAPTATLDMDMDMGMNSDNPRYEELDKFYANFTQQWDSQYDKARKGGKKKIVVSSSPTKQEIDEVYNNGSLVMSAASPVQKKKNEMETREDFDNQNNKRIIISQHQIRGRKQDSRAMISEERNCIVEKKLRELEMLDKGNVDHVMDIEEVLHYYSRLTCPAYLEIVEKFFMELYSEFFSQAPPPATATSASVKSRLMYRSVRT